MFDEYISVNIHQSSYITLKILLIFCSITCIYSKRENHKQILNHYDKMKNYVNAVYKLVAVNYFVFADYVYRLKP